MAAGKKLSDSELIGDAGIALIHRRVSAMGHAWRPLGLDAGIDGSIELRDPATGEVSNRHILVQSKASSRPFPGETADRFHYICDERDLEYWLKSDQPVLLICSHPESDGAWWVHVQSYFADASRRADRRVDFDKRTMSLEGNLTEHLFAVADPQGRAHTPAPAHKRETLESNLLLSRPPAHVYSYATTATRPRDVYDAQRAENLGMRHDFVLKGGLLHTLRIVDETGLGVTVRGEPEVRRIADLAAGTLDDERLAVQLLNRSLRDDLSDDCDFSRERGLLYVRATDDLSDRKWNTAGSNWRTVFKAYRSKKDPGRVSYYRHAAFSWQFLPIEGEWYCALTPDYYFTYDGRHESHFAADLLKKIKSFDRHQAVRQETRMWASILRGEVTLLHQPKPKILEFGQLATFGIDRGIDDPSWKQTAEAAPMVLARSDAALFEVPA
ncbi:DUF4365 domain-containing protein [Gryllotalpicola protaetiae]|uniref:DUF4365 domain-containing protein n=1 Tax=Gryllotalpicola protaetiae TaxID=2419771 RepID=A0A387BVB1_9MICO|nr:DUF4365 domain-containing protein [Gryllotalpicola protaetiae]AYG02341.1 DUF4365 domain-containing protein [Gryllotalpicola protaetiae]